MGRRVQRAHPVPDVDPPAPDHRHGEADQARLEAAQVALESRSVAGASSVVPAAGADVAPETRPRYRGAVVRKLVPAWHRKVVGATPFGLRQRARAWPPGGALVIVAAVVLALAVAYAVLVPMIWPVDDALVDFSISRQPPGREFLFGTDGAGRDVFVRVAAGMRISLLIAVVAAVGSAVLGVLVGVTAGAFGGWWDRVSMRAVDAVNSLPSLLLTLLIVAMYRGSVLAIVLALVLTHWTSIARVVRSEVLALRHAEFVQAARLRGLPRRRIVRRHFLPAASGQALVGVVLLIPHAIWHESTLSFLGVGLPPHRASLGTLLADAQASILLGDWWLLTFPAASLVVVTLAVSVLGRSRQRKLDPSTDGVGEELS